MSVIVGVTVGVVVTVGVGVSVGVTVTVGVTVGVGVTVLVGVWVGVGEGMLDTAIHCDVVHNPKPSIFICVVLFGIPSTSNGKSETATLS